jgi:hypothetical protein
MKLEGVHDGGVSESTLVDMTFDNACRGLIGRQIHKEIRSRVLLRISLNFDPNVRRVVVEH